MACEAKTGAGAGHLTDIFMSLSKLSIGTCPIIESSLMEVDKTTTLPRPPSLQTLPSSLSADIKSKDLSYSIHKAQNKRNIRYFYPTDPVVVEHW